MDPYGVMHREGYWYTAGHCHLRGGLRLFRVDRISEATLLDETFTRPESLDTPESVLDAVANARGDEWPVEVLLKTDMEDARWQLPPIGVSCRRRRAGR